MARKKGPLVAGARQELDRMRDEVQRKIIDEGEHAPYTRRFLEIAYRICGDQANGRLKSRPNR